MRSPRPSSHYRSVLVGLLSLLIASTPLFASDRVLDYLEQYHKLSPTDVPGRMRLADWCKLHDMHQQRADVLAEVLKLDPAHPAAYGELMDADRKRNRPVDKDWAERLANLIDKRFTLHHSQHFTVLTDCDAHTAQLQAEAMEDTYRLFYHHAARIGLRPMPPANRLVCVLFEKFDAYQDFQKRYEGLESAWASGHYSWRTNRTSFFHDRDNPALKEPRDRATALEQELKDLREEMENLPGNQTAARLKLQDRIKRASAEMAFINERLNYVGLTFTLSKTRHEAAHQLLFNSGIQKRGKGYPFWLAEGLAMLFESVDPQGHAGPHLPNEYRIRAFRDLEKKAELLSLADLLRERPKHDDRMETVVGKYAQAWALVHYLWNKHPARLAGYLRAMEEHPNPQFGKLFEMYFGEDLKTIEDAVKAHIAAM
jgi:hypothetical protein